MDSSSEDCLLNCLRIRKFDDFYASPRHYVRVKVHNDRNLLYLHGLKLPNRTTHFDVVFRTMLVQCLLLLVVLNSNLQIGSNCTLVLVKFQFHSLIVSSGGSRGEAWGARTHPSYFGQKKIKGRKKSWPGKQNKTAPPPPAPLAEGLDASLVTAVV